jgi:hypothetical protein
MGAFLPINQPTNPRKHPARRNGKRPALLRRALCLFRAPRPKRAACAWGVRGVGGGGGSGGWVGGFGGGGGACCGRAFLVSGGEAMRLLLGLRASCQKRGGLPAPRAVFFLWGIFTSGFPFSFSHCGIPRADLLSWLRLLM